MVPVKVTVAEEVELEVTATVLPNGTEVLALTD